MAPRKNFNLSEYFVSGFLLLWMIFENLTPLALLSQFLVVKIMHGRLSQYLWSLLAVTSFRRKHEQNYILKWRELLANFSCLFPTFENTHKKIAQIFRQRIGLLLFLIIGLIAFSSYIVKILRLSVPVTGVNWQWLHTIIPLSVKVN